ncbi:type I-F CRISPR-associated endonuclease Cas1f [Providencia vermicola]|uniref:CRISPR-associated endonuclease Cas1 n=2 Tax=Providencia TaxID=586 RepID=A0ABD5L3W5_PROST|nr:MULTISPECIES: type I-F CRISPR-associated endonuclease Cas1f [Providencia]ELR5046046.1 type I-F CRISPR-associated endonuclease Cas1 [Providencia rettgeri]ELR5292080.1 type I-F CRISPR-associated endonuclease Cas1 [Providencia stuartii]ELX8378593.1 type I-F CRISPR-associated endonuclease Cas1 [Providencia stuartii]ELX8381237.1 type I-F CRISPR-associated endonuclease Cas1 [Providencia stuartii]ELZ5939090.1 type I-F CRISPR-associated endonuclease Cas1 [Providencia stuartii]
MDDLSPSDLKTILHSKRANMYYLEHCRVMQKEGRVLYFTEAKNENLYFNIPIANTTVLLLGTGTSITQAAMRMLSQAGVLVGFCGGGGTPLYMATEVEWFTPQSEYRPTEYLQGWMSFWFDEQKRLSAAKTLQCSRINYLQKIWQNSRELKSEGFIYDDTVIQNALKTFQTRTDEANDTQILLLIEAQLTKVLYKYAANNTGQNNFTRQHQAIDKANTFLNHGNYLAYGLAASCLWVLGIPHGFAVMHGKTRRGALIFDIADLIKDAIVLPWAFICAKEGATEQEFRQQILQSFIDNHALDFLFDTVKAIALQAGSQQHIQRSEL